VNEVLSSGFERLVGQKATDEEVRRLHEVKDAVGLADNDALWLVLMALEHYDTLYRDYPARIAEEARRTLADVQRGFADAASLEAKRAHRKLAEAVADAGLKIAAKRTEVARMQGFAVAVAGMVTFGSLCLAMGYALGSGRVPPWTQGTGARRLISAAIGAPAGWVVLLLLLPMAGFWGRVGWMAARAPQATAREAAAGWGLVALAMAGIAALTTLLMRIL
jgi:hypothetical protein